MVKMSNTFLLRRRGEIQKDSMNHSSRMSKEYFADWPLLQPGKERCFCEALDCQQISGLDIEVLLGEKKRGWMEVVRFALIFSGINFA
jgi:hypothetical protein